MKQNEMYRYKISFFKKKVLVPVLLVRQHCFTLLLKIILTGYCFSYHQSGIAQTNNIAWADSCISNSFYGKIVSEGYSDFSRVHTHSSGDLILTGTIKTNYAQTTIARNYVHVMRINIKGDMRWSKFIGINDSTVQVDLRTYGSFAAANGDIVILLSVNASALSGNYIVRLDGEGSVVWQRKLQYLNNTLATLFTDITETADRGFLIVGAAANVAVLMKLDQNGVLVWRKEIISGDFSSNITAVTEGSSAYYIAGTGTKLPGNLSGNFVACLDKDQGDVRWIKWLSFSGETPLTNIAEYEFDFMNYKSGVIALTGNTSFLYPGTNKSAQIAVYMDENANTLSATRIENSEIALDPPNMFQGSLYDAYNKAGVQFRNSDNGDYYVFRLNENNTPLWAWKISLPEAQGAKDTKVLPDSSIVVAGFNRNSDNVVSASVLKTSGTGKLENCNNQPYQISLITAAVSLQDIPNILETGSVTNPSTTSFLDTATGYGFNWQLQCDYTSTCRISKISGRKNVCKGSDNLYTITRGGNCSNAVVFSTNLPALINQISDTSVTISFGSEGIYILYAGMSATCGILKDSTIIQVDKDGTAFSLGPDKVICPGNKILLSAGNEYAAYLWQDASADSVYTINNPGKYYVTVTDVCSNIFSDTININAAPPFEFSVGADRVKCNADTLHISGPSDFYNYSWSPAYNISSVQDQHVTINPMSDTSYTVVAEKYPGCLAFDTVKIQVKHSPPVHLGNDTGVCNGESLLLNAGQGFESYLWSDGKTTATNLITQTGVYSVTGYYSNGCNSSDTISINNNIECLADIYFPGAFTPNNDGRNELFKPSVAFPLNQYRLQIFTKWGQKIFESTDINKGWDGKIKGKSDGVNVFVWICTYQFEGKNRIVKKGTVVLLK